MRVPHIANAKTGCSQLLGGMTMGLHEETVLAPRFSHYANHDLAEYHVVVHTDVGEVDVSWIDEHDPYVNPMRAKGLGEIGILGTAIPTPPASATCRSNLPISSDEET